MPVASSLSDTTLATCDRGSICRCLCCGGLDLSFNGTELAMSAEELADMGRTLDGIRAEAERPGAVWGWSIRARTRRQPEPVVIQLWDDDAEVLSNLILHAQMVLDLDALLLDTVGPRPAA